MKVKFMSLASGSSGNCYYLATDTDAILIDAGIGIRTIKKVFKERGLDMGLIRAVFITHDHADHIKAVGHLAGKHNIPIYSTPEVHQGINRSYCMTEKLDEAHTHFIRKGETMQLKDFHCRAICGFWMKNMLISSHSILCQSAPALMVQRKSMTIKEGRDTLTRP